MLVNIGWGDGFLTPCWISPCSDGDDRGQLQVPPGVKPD